MTVMIERYVIIDEDKNIISNMEDLENKSKKTTCFESIPEYVTLRIYDRLMSKIIARVFTPDLEVNFNLATAIIAELDTENVKETIDDVNEG